MGIFRSKKGTPPVRRPSASAGPVPPPRSAMIAADDLTTCDHLLQRYEAAVDENDVRAFFAAGRAIAVAGGFPAMTGPSLTMHFARLSGQPGNAYQEAEESPWRWLAGVAEVTGNADTAGQVLAARLALASRTWRNFWKERYQTEICTSAAAGAQFQEEVSLIPPPDRFYAKILNRGMAALGTIDDSVEVIRQNMVNPAQSVTVSGAMRELAPEIVELEGAGFTFEATAGMLAGATLSNMLAEQQHASDG